jgi:hypothetical protein
MASSKTRLVLVALAAIACGCGASDAELRKAQTSGYRADFAVVYSEALAATRDLYPQLVEDARTGTIQTGWHPVRGTSDADSGTATSGAGATQTGAGGGQSLTRAGAGGTLYLVRFTVRVVGGKPWRVRVEGESGKLTIGDSMLPVPLRGAEVPPWLAGREKKLRLAIHKRLESYAVPLKYRSSEDRPPPPALDTGKWSGLPAGADKVVAEVERAATTRDVGALRRHMVDDFVWSLGSEPSAEMAVVTWQADPSRLAELARALEGGCAAVEGELVCPSVAAAGDFTGYRVGFARRGDAWKMTYFVEGE